MKKIFCISLCLCLFSALLAGCTSTNEESSAIESLVESVAESSAESTSEIASEEDTSSEESAVAELYDWDFNKDWDVFAGMSDAVVVNDGPVTPVAQCIVAYHRFEEKAETNLLFYVAALVKDEQGRVLSEEEKQAWRSAAQEIGIQFESCDNCREHVLMSFDDMIQFSAWNAENGYEVYLDLCECGAAENHERAVIVPVNP